MKLQTKTQKILVFFGSLLFLLPTLAGAWQVESVFGVTIDSANGFIMGKYLDAMLGFIYSISGGLIVLRMMSGGYGYIQAGGNPQKIEKAKHTIKHAAEGLAIIFLAVIFAQVFSNNLVAGYLY